VFLGVHGPLCKDLVGSPGFLGLQRHAGGHTILPVLINAEELKRHEELRDALAIADDHCGSVYFYRYVFCARIVVGPVTIICFVDSGILSTSRRTC
jgi:hypothetical protein